MRGISTYVRGDVIWIRLSPNASRDLRLKQQFSTKQENTPDGNQVVQQLVKTLHDRLRHVRTGGVYIPQSVVQQVPTIQQIWNDYYELKSKEVSKKGMQHYDDVYRNILSGIAERECTVTGLATFNYANQALPQNVVEQALVNYVAQSDNSDYTKGLRVSCCCAFIKYLNKRANLNIRTDGYTRGVKTTQPAKRVQIYSKEEIALLIESANRTRIQKVGNVFASDCVYVLQLLSDSPLRAHEVLELCYEDFDFTTRRIAVRSKDNNKWEYVVLTKRCESVYNELSEQTKRTTGRLFEISYNGFRMSLKRIAQQAGIELRGRGIHEFRKTYVTRILGQVSDGKLTMADAKMLCRANLNVLEKHYMHIDYTKFIDV